MAVGLIDLARTARLRLLIGRELLNGAEVWRAYRAGTDVPPLRFRSGLTMEHGPGDAPVFLLLEVFANGCYRRRLPRKLRGRVVDIGANIGAFTLDCLQRFPDVQVDAYEPNPETFRALQRNVTVNGLGHRVRLFPEAVAGGSGILTLWPGPGSLAASGYLAGSPERGRGIPVPMVGLDTVVRRVEGPVSYLKIDAEGAEADILEQGVAALAGVQQVAGEYHEALVPGVSARVRAALEKAGFAVDISLDHRCGPVFHARRS